MINTFTSHWKIGGACRSMATSKLLSQFPDVKAAESFFLHNLKDPEESSLTAISNPGSETAQLSYSPITVDYTEAAGSFSPTPVHATDRLQSLNDLVLQLNPKDRDNFLGELFKRISENEGVFVAEDYLPLSLKAMKQLECSGRVICSMDFVKAWLHTEKMVVILYFRPRKLSPDCSSTP